MNIRPEDMPDRPLDPPEPDWRPEPDPDEEYDRERQRQIDERFERKVADNLIEKLKEIARGQIKE